MKFTEKELINYRIERAKDALAEARLLADNNFWNTVANRLYYSCFYMLMALFQKHSIRSTTHSGAKAQFNKHFIKTKIVAQELGEIFTVLSNKRQQGDYQDFRIFNKDEIEPLISQTELFIERLEFIIRKP